MGLFLISFFAPESLRNSTCTCILTQFSFSVKISGRLLSNVDIIVELGRFHEDISTEKVTRKISIFEQWGRLLEVFYAGFCELRER